MKNTSTKYLLDRFAKGLGQQGVTLKRSQLLSLAAFVLGYRNTHEMTDADKRGDLAPPKARVLGHVGISSGEQFYLLHDPVANAAYGLDATFVEQVVEEDRSERYGVSPFGHLLDVSEIAAAPTADVAAVAAPAAAPPAGLIEIHVAMISHKHGDNCEVSLTEDGCYARVADYCREYWTETGLEEAHEDLDDRGIVQAYFEAHDRESCTFSTAQLSLVAPTPVPEATPPGARTLIRTAMKLVQEAIDNHIYDWSNGDEAEPDCGYHAFVRDAERFLAGARTDGASRAGRADTFSHCPECSGHLELDREIGQSVCQSCGLGWDPEDVVPPEEADLEPCPECRGELVQTPKAGIAVCSACGIVWKVHETRMERGEISLAPSNDYRLALSPGHGTYLTVDNMSVHIAHKGEVLNVELLPLGDELVQPLGACEAFFSDGGIADEPAKDAPRRHAGDPSKATLCIVPLRTLVQQTGIDDVDAGLADLGANLVHTLRALRVTHVADKVLGAARNIVTTPRSDAALIADRLTTAVDDGLVDQLMPDGFDNPTNATRIDKTMGSIAAFAERLRIDEPAEAVLAMIECVLHASSFSGSEPLRFAERLLMATEMDRANESDGNLASRRDAIIATIAGAIRPANPKTDDKDRAVVASAGPCPGCGRTHGFHLNNVPLTAYCYCAPDDKGGFEAVVPGKHQPYGEGPPATRWRAIRM